MIPAIQVSDSGLLKQYMQAGTIINRLLSALHRKEVPSSFLAFDLETSGFHPTRDVILEWGHCQVIDGEVTDRTSVLVNWYAGDTVPARYLDEQLARLTRDMRLANKSWRITPQLLREQGLPPARFVPWLYDFLTEIKSQGHPFVSHNGVNFDCKRVQSHFEQDLGKTFDFGEDQVFDTGAIEKASQMTGALAGAAMPRPGESMRAYFSRIAYCKAPGVFWNVEACAAKYKLVEKYGLDPHQLHSAGEDAFALVCLVNEFRLLSEAARGSAQAEGLDPAEFRREYLHQPIASQRPGGGVRQPMPWEPARPAARPAAPAVSRRGQRSR